MEEKLKILIIDDDEMDRMIIKHRLKSTGQKLEILETEFANEGIRIIKEKVFDAVLLDYQLPDKNGFQFLQEVKEFNNSPVIVLTGMQDTELGPRLLKEGAQDYLLKDELNGNVLLNLIRHARERRRTIEALKKAKKEIANAYKIKNELISSLGKEIIEPVISIGKKTELLYKTTPTNEQKQLIDNVNESAQKLLHYIKDVINKQERYDNKSTAEEVTTNENTAFPNP